MPKAMLVMKVLSFATVDQYLFVAIAELFIKVVDCSAIPVLILESLILSSLDFLQLATQLYFPVYSSLDRAYQ